MEDKSSLFYNFKNCGILCEEHLILGELTGLKICILYKHSATARRKQNKKTKK